MTATIDTVTLPKDFVDQLIQAIHLHSEALYIASQTSKATSVLINQKELCRNNLKHLKKSLDKTSGELFDIAMTVKITAYGADETIVCGADEDMTAFSDDIGVINDNWRFSS